MDEKIKALATKEGIKTLARKAELKSEQDKIEKLQTHDLSHLLENFFLGVDGFQNMFAYQPTRNTLELKKDKGTDYFLIWELKGAYTSKLRTLHTTFLHIIKLSGYKLRIKFDKGFLVVEQNNYATKILMLTLSVI